MHKSAEELFAAALELTNPAERGALLDRKCAGNSALRAEVESLLAAHAQAGTFFNQLDPAVLVNVSVEKPGDRIGRYKLREKVGEGGCGVVYVAEQEEPIRRRVALKVIKLGMDTRQVIARFEAERQALALMDHPLVAKVFDAGATDTGRPYFVMELVRGARITDYCDEHQLSTRDRLRLFIQVCQAIQHAHQKGIIHRDLKPSNVLVASHDGVAAPRVIDFGIAKATEQGLSEETLTESHLFLGTPAYMSPEQTRGQELLTGRLPFDREELRRAGFEEICRRIREEEPPRPSTRLSALPPADLTVLALRRQTEPAKLTSQIRGDLDWIVMKALEKDRARRYESAVALAEDVQRHLDHQPVVACPPTRLYQFKKFARRHRAAFAAVSAIAAVLVAGVIVSTWQAVRATRAEREQSRLRHIAETAQTNEARLRVEAETNARRAHTQANRSDHVSWFLTDVLKGVQPSVALGRDTTILKEILDRAAERVGPELKSDPEAEAVVRVTLGETYRKLGLFAQAGRLDIAEVIEDSKGLAVLEDQAMLVRRWRRGDDVVGARPGRPIGRRSARTRRVGGGGTVTHGGRRPPSRGGPQQSSPSARPSSRIGRGSPASG